MVATLKMLQKLILKINKKYDEYTFLGYDIRMVFVKRSVFCAKLVEHFFVLSFHLRYVNVSPDGIIQSFTHSNTLYS